MNPELVLGIGRDALGMLLLLASPLLLVALLVGVVIGVLQAATQINEMTLAFIPKLFAMALTGYLAGPWMLKLLVGYTRALFEGIPGMLR